MSLGEIPLFFKIGEEPEKIKKTLIFSPFSPDLFLSRITRFFGEGFKID